MIQEDFVSFETAKLLKEKGFDEECRAFYVKSKECGIELFPVGRSHNYNDDVYPCISAPTHQMAMAWLRKKGIIITIDYNNDVELEDEEDKRYGFCVYAKPHDIIDYNTYLTYEEAVEAALKYVLENLLEE